MTVLRARTSHESGESEVQAMPSAGSVTRSSDYADSGLKASLGVTSRHVHSAEELQDHELVTIEGMELQVRHARELGLLNKVLDEPLSAAAAAQGADQAVVGATEADAAEETAQPAPEGSPEAVSEALTAMVEAGTMTMAEKTVAETAVGEFALAGIDTEQAVELLGKVAEGEIDGIETQHLRIAQEAETKVTAASTKAAQAELGPDAFNYLAQAAASSQDVADAIRGYAIQRATGKADGATWVDLYNDVVAHIRGGAE